MRMIGLALIASVAMAGFVAAVRAPAAELVPTTHEVRMVLENDEYRFEPAELTINQGESVRFVMVSGAPHNVAFDPEQIPAAVRPRLTANMPNQMSPLAGPLLVETGDSYVISFAGVPPGTYAYFCMPHIAMDMKGTITVHP
jgi:plastocyanin